jgi:N-acetylneuraminic acid mutarotase
MKKNILILLWLSAGIFMSCEEHDLPKPIIVSFNPTADGVNAEVVIRGKNFGANKTAVSLDFNGAPAVVHEVRDTLIVTHVPEGATTGKINVAVDGRRTSSEEDFTMLSGEWERLNDLPDPSRAYAVAFTIGNKAYVGTGIEPPVPLNDFYEYDPSADQWTAKSEIPLVRYQSVAFEVNGKGYVGLGRGDNIDAFSDMNSFDPITNEWAPIAAFPGGIRQSATAFSIGDKGYVGLGLKYVEGVFTYYKDLWQYDPSTEEWAQVADFPGDARDRAIGLSLDGKGYVGLGFPFHDWWQFDPVANSWTQLAPYPEENSVLDVSGFVLNGKIYIVGGYSSQCWEYDPSQDKWQRQTSLPEHYGGNVAFSIGNAGYVCTGASTPENKLWKFVVN